MSCTIQCPFLYLHIFEWNESINVLFLRLNEWENPISDWLGKSLLQDGTPKLNTFSGSLTSPRTVLSLLDGFNNSESSNSLLDAKHKVSESVSHSVVSNSLLPHGLQPTRLLCPWNSLGKNTGVGCHSLLKIFPNQESNLGLLHCRWILYHLSH